MFRQSIVHQDYLLNLYELFKEFCSLGPKIVSPMPHKKTGKVYPAAWFKTMSLPCFNELYDLIYLDGKKIVPLNIAELLTVYSLSYWLCDDGSFVKQDQ